MNVVHSSKPVIPALGLDDWRVEKPQQDEISLRAIFSVLNYRRWRVLAPAVVLGLLAAVAALRMPDYYTSGTQVMLNSTEPNLVDIDSVITTLPQDSRLIEGEIAVVLSNKTLHNVALALDLYDDPEFAPDPLARAADTGAPADGAAAVSAGPANPPAAVGGPADDTVALSAAQIKTIEELRDALSVSQVGLSLVISIAATSNDPAKAARIANAIAQEYIESQVDMRVAATRDAVDWIGERVESLRHRLEEAEMAVEAVKADMAAEDGQTSELTYQQLTETSSQLVVEKARRAEADARMSEIERRIAADGIASVELLVPTQSTARLREEIDALAVERSQLTTQFGASSPRLQSLDAQIKDLQNRLQDQIVRGVSALAGEAAAARAREDEVAATLGQLEQRIADQADKALELRQLERIAEADRSIYETFLARLNELTQQIDIHQADARVISAAAPPELPAGPNRKLIVLAAAVFGLFLGGASALAMEAARTNFLTDIDVTRRTGLRVVTRLPRVGRKTSLLHVLKAANADPFGPLGQASRDINVALLGAGNGRVRVILVTSATRGEGCTVLSALTAHALARIGQHAVVIDCNFAEPALSRSLGATAGPDVIDVLLGNAALEAAIRRDVRTGITYLPLVERRGYGPEVLYTDEFEGMLAQLRNSYDAVILDAAPLTVSPDAAAISRMTDLVLLAIRWADTSEEVVNSALAQLRRGGASRLGAVLTGVDTEAEAVYRQRVYNLRTA